MAQTTIVYSKQDIEKIVVEEVERKTSHIIARLDKQHERLIDIERMLNNLFEVKNGLKK